jgi:3-methylfumaryl-CoA hydratase
LQEAEIHGERTLDAAEFQDLTRWVGRSETVTDEVTIRPIIALAATLDIDAPPPQHGDSVGPLWHWLYFLPAQKQSDLAPDGIAERGTFWPPVSLPRRMWAGSRFEFRQPIRIGQTITRTSRILDIRSKEGRTGPLVFVIARHEISNERRIAIVEEQDVVYRDLAKPGAAATQVESAPRDHAWERVIHPDDVLLFRYSALTFNGHRIHYDRRFATETEGYPGLVVHGPLIATLLLDLLRRNMPTARVTRFSFRAVSPLFDTAPFSVCGRLEANGKTASLWAKNSASGLASTATAQLG